MQTKIFTGNVNSLKGIDFLEKEMDEFVVGKVVHSVNPMFNGSHIVIVIFYSDGGCVSCPKNKQE